MAQNTIKASEISEILYRQLKGIDTSLKYEEVGNVLTVSDGVARIYGLSKAEAGELLEFDCGVKAVVMNLEEDSVGAVLLGPTDQVKEDMRVRRLGRIAGIDVGEGLVGRVVDPIGTPLDGLGKVQGETVRMPLERKAPGVIFREPVHEPLQTGLKAIDSMIPIGRGQRELIIGDRQTDGLYYSGGCHGRRSRRSPVLRSFCRSSYRRVFPRYRPSCPCGIRRLEQAGRRLP